MSFDELNRLRDADLFQSVIINIALALDTSLETAENLMQTYSNVDVLRAIKLGVGKEGFKSAGYDPGKLEHNELNSLHDDMVSIRNKEPMSDSSFKKLQKIISM